MNINCVTCVKKYDTKSHNSHVHKIGFERDTHTECLVPVCGIFDWWHVNHSALRLIEATHRSNERVWVMDESRWTRLKQCLVNKLSASSSSFRLFVGWNVASCCLGFHVIFPILIWIFIWILISNWAHLIIWSIEDSFFANIAQLMQSCIWARIDLITSNRSETDLICELR